jgi:hypothetical protein
MTAQPNDLNNLNDTDNIIELGGGHLWADREGAAEAAMHVRNQLSLLYGYAESSKACHPNGSRRSSR